MGRRSDAKTLFECAALGGIGAVIGAFALPAGSPYFLPLIILGGAAAIIGLGGLLWLLIFPEKPAPPQLKAGSTTARARGNSRITIEDSISTADNLADAEEEASILASGVIHDPSGTAGRPSPQNRPGGNPGKERGGDNETKLLR